MKRILASLSFLLFAAAIPAEAAFAATGPGGRRIVLGEWDGVGTEGWGVSQDANTKSVTRAFTSSKEPSVPDAGDPVCALAVSGADPRLVFLAQRKFGLFRSTDGCRTWTEITGDIAYAKPLVLRYNPATRELWAAGPAAFRTKR